MDGAAKFVDSLLRTAKTEQENDKIIFFFLPRRVCTRRLHTNNIFPQTLALKSQFESETNLFMEKRAEVAAAAFGPFGHQQAAGALSVRGELALARLSHVTARPRGPI